MLRHVLSLLFAGLLSIVYCTPGYAQENNQTIPLTEVTVSKDTTAMEVVVIDGYQLNDKQLKRYHRQQRKDSIRANKNLWLSILGGPSYTPEASLGVGGAMLASFRLNKLDTISQRSFLPIGFNLSLNGTVVIAGAGTFFFNENKFRIYTSYSFRNEPSNYYGKGYDAISEVEMGDSTTLFKKMSLQLYPRFVWELKPHFYVGGLFDINYSRSTDINVHMKEDHYFNKYKPEYLNIGLGGLIQYDTRDDVATPTRGVLLSVNGKAFGKYFGGDYNYEQLELEYRHFKNVFRPRSTLGWIVKSQMSFGDVPFTELPSFGSPFDLRGYYWGKYRDKSMTYGIVEYRHMFGSPAQYKSGNFWAKLGFVTWVGTGSISNVPFTWNEWKFNYGAGLRIQMQPGKNFRLDIGKEPGQGMLFYMNMTEAF